MINSSTPSRLSTFKTPALPANKCQLNPSHTVHTVTVWTLVHSYLALFQTSDPKIRWLLSDLNLKYYSNRTILYIRCINKEVILKGQINLYFFKQSHILLFISSTSSIKVESLHPTYPSYNSNLKILHTTSDYCLFLSCPKIPVFVLKILIQLDVVLQRCHAWLSFLLGISRGEIR